MCPFCMYTTTGNQIPVIWLQQTSIKICDLSWILHEQLYNVCILDEYVKYILYIIYSI